MNDENCPDNGQLKKAVRIAAIADRAASEEEAVERSDPEEPSGCRSTSPSIGDDWPCGSQYTSSGETISIGYSSHNDEDSTYADEQMNATCECSSKREEPRKTVAPQPLTVAEHRSEAQPPKHLRKNVPQCAAHPAAPSHQGGNTSPQTK